jgi:hypothetical protein
MARQMTVPCPGGCDKDDLIVRGEVSRCSRCRSFFRWRGGAHIPETEGARMRPTT